MPTTLIIIIRGYCKNIDNKSNIPTALCMTLYCKIGWVRYYNIMFNGYILNALTLSSLSTIVFLFVG